MQAGVSAAKSKAAVNSCKGSGGVSVSVRGPYMPARGAEMHRLCCARTCVQDRCGRVGLAALLWACVRVLGRVAWNSFQSSTAA